MNHSNMNSVYAGLGIRLGYSQHINGFHSYMSKQSRLSRHLNCQNIFLYEIHHFYISPQLNHLDSLDHLDGPLFIRLLHTISPRPRNRRPRPTQHYDLAKEPI